MALPESSMSLEPWTTFNSIGDLWSNEIFNQETETLTKALQVSLSSGSETLAAAEFDDAASFQYRINLPEMEPAPAPATTSGSDPESSSSRRQPSVLSSVSNRKIAKRKSRGTKRSSTTFIAADPANFRQMVQQVTGKRFSDGHVAAAQVLRPEAHRPSEWMLQSCHLPTLDTSAVLLKKQKMDAVKQSQFEAVMNDETALPAVASGGAGFEFEKFHQSFPTLESWGVM